jgi:hypothetical protein
MTNNLIPTADDTYRALTLLIRAALILHPTAAASILNDDADPLLDIIRDIASDDLDIDDDMLLDLFDHLAN